MPKTDEAGIENQLGCRHVLVEHRIYSSVQALHFCVNGCCAIALCCYLRGIFGDAATQIGCHAQSVVFEKVFGSHEGIGGYIGQVVNEVVVACYVKDKNGRDLILQVESYTWEIRLDWNGSIGQNPLSERQQVTLD